MVNFINLLMDSADTEKLADPLASTSKESVMRSASIIAFCRACAPADFAPCLKMNPIDRPPYYYITYKTVLHF